MATSKTGFECTKVEENDNADPYKENDERSPSSVSSNCRFPCEIMGKSSVHALSQVGQAKSGLRQIFWTVVLLMSMCGCIYEVNSFLSTFLQYPVLIDVKVQNRNPQEFPAVTVCNLNRLRDKHLKCASKSSPWFKCNYDYKWRPQPTRMPFFTEIKALFSVSNLTTEPEKIYKKRAREILSGYSILDVDSRNCYGHRLHNLIKRCSFNSVKCKHTDFSYFYDKQYGNCYTFNTRSKEEVDYRSVKKIGPGSGLELVLDLETDTYAEISPSSGARVTIHSPQELPNPLENGINIIPGFESHASLVTISHHRLPPPYRDMCKNYEVHGNIQKNQLTCTNECVQRNSMHKCGCVDPFLPNYQNTLHCNLVNDTQMSCLVQVLEEMSTEKQTCDCPLPCLNTIYDLQVTSTKWKPGAQVNDKYFGQTYDPDFCSSGYVSSTFESYSKLNVFFKSLDHEIYAQKPMYSDSELYSHLGGNLSLWLGLSFVAMYEFAENIFIFSKHFLGPHKLKR